MTGRKRDFGLLKSILWNRSQSSRDNVKKQLKKIIVVIFTCILFLAVPLSCEGVLAHMLFLSASFPIWKIIPVLDPQLTGVFRSPGRWCLCCACRILDKRHCINKGDHSYYSVHGGSEVCLMPCPLSSCLLALKSPLCLYPGAQLFWSSCSQINWTGAFEIPSSLPNLLIFQAFYKLFSLLRKENRKRHHLEWQLLGSFISSAFFLKGPPAPQLISSKTSPTLWRLDAGL